MVAAIAYSLLYGVSSAAMASPHQPAGNPAFARSTAPLSAPAPTGELERHVSSHPKAGLGRRTGHRVPPPREQPSVGPALARIAPGEVSPLLGPSCLPRRTPHLPGVPWTGDPWCCHTPDGAEDCRRAPGTPFLSAALRPVRGRRTRPGGRRGAVHRRPADDVALALARIRLPASSSQRALTPERVKQSLFRATPLRA